MLQVKKGTAQAEALSRNRRGFSSKPHASGDVLRNPRHFILTPGQDYENGPAQEFLGDDEPGAVVVV